MPTAFHRPCLRGVILHASSSPTVRSVYRPLADRASCLLVLIGSYVYRVSVACTREYSVLLHIESLRAEPPLMPLVVLLVSLFVLVLRCSLALSVVVGSLLLSISRVNPFGAGISKTET